MTVGEIGLQNDLAVVSASQRGYIKKNVWEPHIWTNNVKNKSQPFTSSESAQQYG